LEYKIIIPARANSKRLPGKNMKLLGGKPLIEYSIDTALLHFPKESVWVNTDDDQIIKYAKLKGLNTILRPDNLALDSTTTVDVLKHQIGYFKNRNIKCNAIILLQPTNPFREDDLLEYAILKFEESGRNSLATFSKNEKKLGKIEGDFFRPTNYSPGQRSQDLENSYFENGLLYITKVESILKNKIITDDVFPIICDNVKATVDIDYLEDFIFAEALLKIK
jgi:N-acylneuraminate cytidylyltransferase